MKLPNYIKQLKFLFMPRFWLMNDPYSKEWDIKLNELLDKYEFTHVTHHRANLSDKNLWIENYPYSTFTLNLPEYPYEVRASRLTIQRANKKLDRIAKKTKQELIRTEINKIS